MHVLQLSAEWLLLFDYAAQHAAMLCVHMVLNM